MRLFPRAAVRDGMARYAAWLNGLVTPELVERDLLVEAPLVHPAAAIRREALARAGGWRDGDFPEDYDLWLRLAAAGGRLSNVSAPVLGWRESPGRLTRTDPRYALERHVALKCAHLARHVLPGAREVALWGAGRTGKAFADALRREGIATALFVEVDRAKIGRTLRGAPVISVRAGGAGPRAPAAGGRRRAGRARAHPGRARPGRLPGAPGLPLRGVRRAGDRQHPGSAPRTRRPRRITLGRGQIPGRPYRALGRPGRWSGPVVRRADGPAETHYSGSGGR